MKTMTNNEKRPEWRHPRMTREQRAKQFLPFQAVKGYEEALRVKEKEYEEALAGEVERVSEEPADAGLADVSGTEEDFHGDPIV
ncbi:MAG: hypothetical protein II642_06890 [Firmicutes bacterium]|nr:hypothetical protein [Bacillota bacterium]